MKALLWGAAILCVVGAAAALVMALPPDESARTTAQAMAVLSGQPAPQETTLSDVALPAIGLAALALILGAAGSIIDRLDKK
jgi:hypothetical protein